MKAQGRDFQRQLLKYQFSAIGRAVIDYNDLMFDAFIRKPQKEIADCGGDSSLLHCWQELLSKAS